MQRHSRRKFIGLAAAAGGSVFTGCLVRRQSTAPLLIPADHLPKGNAPEALSFAHFPSRLHAFVWRNWQLVPVQRMAQVVGASERDILRMGKAMGLAEPARITRTQQERSFITVIRRNWHLLPYEQLLALLGWTAEQLDYVLREDDFLFIKLGSLKPRCEVLRYAPPDEAMREKEKEVASIVRCYFPEGAGRSEEPLFHFVSELSRAPVSRAKSVRPQSDSIRFCYSYFALYGDPLLNAKADPYPEGYLAQLSELGVNGVWIHAVLYKLAPFPWQPSLSKDYEQRLRNLAALVARARKQGIGVYLYLNEPRAMPLSFFTGREQMKGVVEGTHAALCTSHDAVRQFIRESIASICKAVPDLAGFFSISGSENLTNCWSHHQGHNCPRCKQRPLAEVIAEVNGTFAEGIKQAGSSAKLLVWDWGWQDTWVPEIISRLPLDTMLMSVSEWDIPLKRGGIDSIVQEYSISAVGPGPRAQRHWELARKRGLKTIAKIQAGNTWELSSVPYIPALGNVAQHIANLRQANIDGVMLGWTLGGYPSPNLELVSELMDGETNDPQVVLHRVAERRFGSKLAPHVVEAWNTFSAAFSEFPYHQQVVYLAPLQMGPANLLWLKPTGYRATMVGIPYDDLNGWRAVYPIEVFLEQLEKVATGFEAGLKKLQQAVRQLDLSVRERAALRREMNVAEAAGIHFRSVANQVRYVSMRDAGVAADNNTLKQILSAEREAALQLYQLQAQDSRIGFEASNHYFYVPLDLAEKVLNCEYLLKTV